MKHSIGELEVVAVTCNLYSANRNYAINFLTPSCFSIDCNEMGTTKGIHCGSLQNGV